MKPVRVKSESVHKTKSKKKGGKDKLLEKFTSDVNITEEGGGSRSFKVKDVKRNNKQKNKQVFIERDASGKVVLKSVQKKKVKKGELVKDKERIRKRRTA
jgi:hypothetical protein